MERAKVATQTQTGEEKVNRKVYVPKVDIYETGDSMVLLIDMPGTDENSVEVTLDRNVLTVHGKVEQEKIEGYTLAYTEYATGDYQRAFTISDEIDRERIDAVVKNGVLKITLHKAEQAKARKIAITAG